MLLLPHQSSPVTYPPQRPTDPSNVKLETLYPRCFLEFIPNCTNTFNSSSSYNGNDPKRLHRISRLVYLNQLTDGTLTRETGIFWSVLILNESFLCITVSFRWRFVCWGRISSKQLLDLFVTLVIIYECVLLSYFFLRLYLKSFQCIREVEPGFGFKEKRREKNRHFTPFNRFSIFKCPCNFPYLYNFTCVTNETKMIRNL